MEKLKPIIELDNVSMYYHDKNTVNVGISKMSLKFYCVWAREGHPATPKLSSTLLSIPGTLTSPSVSSLSSCKRKSIPGSTEVYSCRRSQKSKNNPWNSAI